jgi:hypothetical protein
MSRGDAPNNHKAYSFRGVLEARVGFEPTNGGFADLSLGPLGYRAESLSIANAPFFSLFSTPLCRTSFVAEGSFSVDSAKRKLRIGVTSASCPLCS